MIANMKAGLIYRYRRDYGDGALVEAVIWRLPQPLPARRVGWVATPSQPNLHCSFHSAVFMKQFNSAEKAA
jgi:hypothetical protein